MSQQRILAQETRFFNQCSDYLWLRQYQHVLSANACNHAVHTISSDLLSLSAKDVPITLACIVFSVCPFRLTVGAQVPEPESVAPPEEILPVTWAAIPCSGPLPRHTTPSRCQPYYVWDGEGWDSATISQGDQNVPEHVRRTEFCGTLLQLTNSPVA